MQNRRRRRRRRKTGRMKRRIMTTTNQISNRWVGIVGPRDGKTHLHVMPDRAKWERGHARKKKSDIQNI